MGNKWTQLAVFWGAWLLVSVLVGFVWPNSRDTDYGSGRGITGLLGLTWGNGLLGFLITVLLYMVAAAIFGFRMLL